MKKSELEAVVRFCLTHAEQYSKDKPANDAVKLNERDDYWLVVRPDRAKPGELLAGTAEHREKLIVAWQGFASAAFPDAS